MKAAVVVFPGSNCDRDLAVALEAAAGRPPAMVWHKETALPDGLDLVALPGGFSFGDYLRPGAIAAQAPIMGAVAAHAAAGGLVFGVCNGWQILVEAGLLPGALLRNRATRFLSERCALRVEQAASPFTASYEAGAIIRMPLAHHDGAFFADDALVAALEAEARIAFRYVDAEGAASAAGNPNGSTANIAGVLSENQRVLGMMPHPERMADPALGGADGAALFQSVARSILEMAG